MIHSLAMFILNLFIALLPYLCLLGTIWFCRLLGSRKEPFSAVVRGSVIWGLIVWLETNILSWLDLIYGTIIGGFWLFYFIVLALLLYKFRRIWHIPAITGWQWAPFSIAVLSLIAALAYPPNNFDVLTYHMPRVMHWLQNHSMAPYPTSIDRQIGMAPFNAMIALQSYAPYRIDYFVNLSQWLAFIGCFAGVGQITAMLGGNKIAQSCAIIFIATLPVAIIQASNTESCLLVTFYICAMAYAFLEWWKDPEPKPGKMVLFGACLGLAILSKGSAYPIAFPFVCLIGWRCLKHPGKLLIQGLAAAILIAAINAPHFVRTLDGADSMVASAERNILAKPTPGTFVVNILYNFISNQPILLVNGGRACLEKFSAALGVSHDDKTVLPFGGLASVPDYYSPAEGKVPNPFQSTFIILLGLAIIFRKFRAPVLYTSAVFSSFILFCLILTWHPWVSRIHTTLFALAAPVCGLYMDSIRKTWLRNSLLAICCFCAIWPVFLCVERPLAPARFVDLYRHNIRHFLSSPRELLLFNNSPPVADEYVAAANFLAERNVRNIGVRLGSNGLEYPLWSLLGTSMDNMPRIEHISKEQKKYLPSYIFEFVREDIAPQQPARVIEVMDGKEMIVFPPAGYGVISEDKASE